ncbi:alpha/beta-hydrolase, partial [Testicularia cyperi]
DPHLRQCLHIVQTASTSFVPIGPGVKIAYRWLDLSDNVQIAPAASSKAPTAADAAGNASCRSRIPLVMQVDFRSGMDLWDPLFLAHLLTRRPVLIFDPCHCGRSISDRDTRPYMGSLYKWAKHLVAVTENLAFPEYDVFGLSMGGAAALLTALFPTPATSRVRKIIAGATTGPAITTRLYEECARSSMSIPWPRDDWNLMDASLYSYSDGNDSGEVRDTMRGVFFTNTRQGQEAMQAYWTRINAAAEVRAALPGESPSIRLLEDRRDLGPLRCQRLAWRSWESAPSNPSAYADPMASIDKPVLVLNGVNSALIPASRSWELVCRLPKASLVLYENASAGFAYQYPDRVARDINNFLDLDHTQLEAQSLPSAALP